MTTTPDDVDELVDQIKDLLRGRGPQLQGAALADLVSMYFAGHHPALREEQIEAWMKCMRGLIPVNEKGLFAIHGKPSGWDTQ